MSDKQGEQLELISRNEAIVPKRKYRKLPEIKPGDKFGMLTAVRIADPYISPKTGRRLSRWEMLCECGAKVTLIRADLYETGRPTRSCRLCGHKRTGLSSRSKDPESLALITRIKACQRGAKKRNYKWELTYEEAVGILKENCVYCGAAPKPYFAYLDKNGNLHKGKRKVDLQYAKTIMTIINTIDRLDSLLDYVLDNCVPACLTCNTAKSNMSYNAFLEWLKRLALNNGYMSPWLAKQFEASNAALKETNKKLEEQIRVLKRQMQFLSTKLHVVAS